MDTKSSSIINFEPINKKIKIKNSEIKTQKRRDFFYINKKKKHRIFLKQKWNNKKKRNNVKKSKKIKKFTIFIYQIKLNVNDKQIQTQFNNATNKN